MSGKQGRCNPKCSCDERGDPWRDETAFPSTDDDTVALMDGAVGSLVLLRCPLAGGDAGATLSCLVSLATEAESRLWDVVADARDQDYTWGEIADRLASTAGSARRRYAAYARWRRSLACEHD